MARGDLFGMIYNLAERGLNRSLAGEGSQESRVVALILSAIDQLATAASMDATLSPSINQAIDVLRQKVEENSGRKKGREDWRETPTKKSPPTSKEVEGGDENIEAGEEEEGEEDA